MILVICQFGYSIIKLKLVTSTADSLFAIAMEYLILLKNSWSYDPVVAEYVHMKKPCLP